MAIKPRRGKATGQGKTKRARLMNLKFAHPRQASLAQNQLLKSGFFAVR
jgi:hypothetical protein